MWINWDKHRGEACMEGQRLYWDATASKPTLTVVPKDNTFAGVAAENASRRAVTVLLRVTPGGAPAKSPGVGSAV